jgi:hypothetical protein
VGGGLPAERKPLTFRIYLTHPSFSLRLCRAHASQFEFQGLVSKNLLIQGNNRLGKVGTQEKNKKILNNFPCTMNGPEADVNGE